MELTPQTFISLDERTDTLQRLALRIASGGRAMGLLPGYEFSCDGIFVRNAFQVDRLQCTALLPSGDVVQIDEQVFVKIPMLYGSVYYLTVSLANGVQSVEDRGVPMIRPLNNYEIHSPEEVDAQRLLPLVRFQVKEGMFGIDKDFIPPCVSLSSNSKFAVFIEDYCLLMEKLAFHPHLKEGDGKRLFLRYLFLLKAYPLNHSLYDFVLFTQEIAQAVDYFVVAPHTKAADIPQPLDYDIQLWLEWLKGYLTGGCSILDTVELHEEEFDVEKFKAQIKAEIYERLNPELYERLIRDLKENLRLELSESLKSFLSDSLEKHLKPQLHNALSEELGSRLFDDLYQALYDRLFNALRLPEEEVDDFVPLI